MRKVITMMVGAGLALGGCGRKTEPTLPADPIDQAAACSAVQVASEQEKIGPAAHLSGEAQGRVFHYALLAASSGKGFDSDTANAVFKRAPQLFDQTIKGNWKALKPACAAAFPATQSAHPALPTAPFESELECYTLADFMRKGLGQQVGSYSNAVLAYGVLSDKLDAKMAPEIRRVGLTGQKLQDRKGEALSSVAKLGPPPTVFAACQAKYG